MTSTKKISDQGWFYHAPSKPKPRTGPVPLPPISQIPGLSNLSHLPEEPCKQTWFRSTDSEYVKLAKQGGRPDLLTMRSPKPLSDAPVGYPRCEWFYDAHYDPNPPQPLEKPYVFLLPPYMVHEPMPKCERGDVCAKFGVDREDDKVCDKGAKIEEQRKFGYGVRTEKEAAKGVQPHNAAAKGPTYEKLTSDDIKKLLSHGYAKDYDAQQDKLLQDQCHRTENDRKMRRHEASKKIHTAKNQRGVCQNVVSKGYHGQKTGKKDFVENI